MNLKDHDFNLQLTLIILVVLLAVIACCFIANLQGMENRLEEKLDRLLIFSFNVETITEPIWELKVQSQRDLYLIFHQLEIIAENTRQLTFDELIDMAMEEDE